MLHCYLISRFNPTATEGKGEKGRGRPPGKAQESEVSRREGLYVS
jgi:hypothetical protein